MYVPSNNTQHVFGFLIITSFVMFAGFDRSCDGCFDAGYHSLPDQCQYL